jgi:hypothetical protein
MVLLSSNPGKYFSLQMKQVLFSTHEIFHFSEVEAQQFIT